MKIEKYTKIKGNKYSVYIDGVAVKLYDDVIVKYELLRKKEISNELFAEITEYNDYLEAYYKALKYITKKLRTEKEIYIYLEKNYEKKVIKETIIKLKKDGYLNEDIYIKSFIGDQLILGKMGPNKIISELINLGCNEEKVRNEVAKIEENVWFERIEKIIKKKIRLNKSYGINKLRDKITYELGNIGYYKWMIDEILNNINYDEQDDILIKEYKRVCSKLERKYEGKELELKIITKLLSKGFTYEQIKKVLND